MSADTATQATATTRRARLFVTKMDPWSVMKTAFVLSLGLAVVTLVATALIWGLFNALGVIEAVNSTVNDVGGGKGAINVGNLFSFGQVMGMTLIFTALEIILVTAFATVLSVLYNLTVGFTGGIQVTLSEEE